MTHQEKWVSYLTIVRKDTYRFIRLWVQTLLPSVITTALYFLIFGYALGNRIHIIGGVDYDSFIAPGLIMLGIITSSFLGSSFPFFLAQFNKSIDEIMVTPTPLWLMLAGFMSLGVIRGIAIAILVGTVAWFFTGFHIAHLFLTFFMVVLTGLTFSCIGLISAIYSDNFDQISIVPNFVLTPLIYLGGVFYAISNLPSPWNIISLFNPVYYIVNAFRYSLLGIDTPHLIGSITAVSCMFVLFFLVAIRLFDSKVGVRP